MHQETVHPPLPSRAQSLVFLLKAKLLQANRAVRNMTHSVPKHALGEALTDSPLSAEVRAELWNQSGAAEYSLTAGKVQNLRVACRLLHGTEVPADGVFSFWRQLGRIRQGAGYATGRELRSGCLVPTLGGGLCALSGLLYEAAVASGCEITERHGHSRFLPGMSADPRRDATVFWNYIDLRFRTAVPLRIEATLEIAVLSLQVKSCYSG